MPIERLQAFYKIYCRPDNTIEIIAGKFDEAAAIRLLKTIIPSRKATKEYLGEEADHED